MPLQKVAPGQTRIGWIGTGVMGRWMCQHLMAKGYATTVYNRSADKLKPLLDAGAVRADSPRALADPSWTRTSNCRTAHADRARRWRVAESPSAIVRSHRTRLHLKSAATSDSSYIAAIAPARNKPPDLPSCRTRHFRIEPSASSRLA